MSSGYLYFSEMHQTTKKGADRKNNAWGIEICPPRECAPSHFFAAFYRILYFVLINFQVFLLLKLLVPGLPKSASYRFVREA